MNPEAWLTLQSLPGSDWGYLPQVPAWNLSLTWLLPFSWIALPSSLLDSLQITCILFIILGLPSGEPNKDTPLLDASIWRSGWKFQLIVTKANVSPCPTYPFLLPSLLGVPTFSQLPRHKALEPSLITSFLLSDLLTFYCLQNVFIYLISFGSQNTL